MSNFAVHLFYNCTRIARKQVRQPCALCGAAHRGDAVCRACSRELPHLPAVTCAICASPLETGEICGACLAHPPRYDRVVAAYLYEFPLDALIHAYKYGGELRLAGWLGRALAQRITGTVDAVIPMPLSPQRVVTRGFNQALELAREIARLHEATLWPDACRRVADTPPQALLPWRERARNIRGAFVCDADVTGKRIAVVDDVLTTGATLNELARNLKRAGAVEVQGWVAARAVKRSYRPREDDGMPH